MKLLTLAVLIAIAAAPRGAAAAGPVGERHLVAHEASAAVRDAQHSDQLRITVWYPAADGSEERAVVEGPRAHPLFDVGRAAPDAPFAAETARRPVILLSHGFGGTARMMGWLGIPLARSGYVVIGVDHPGNNGADPMTIAGAMLWWDRARDLRTALVAVLRDASIGPHLDAGHLGLAGFSAGGFTVFAAAGARVDRAHFFAFCGAHPDDGICRPQLEFQFSRAEAEAAERQPDIATEIAHAGDDYAIPGARAVFALAPALVQAFDPGSLQGLRIPIAIVLGEADTVAPPATNGLVAGALIPEARVTQLPGVGHYDFLSDCTDAGRAAVPICRTAMPQEETHVAALDAARALFAATLAAP